MKRFSYLLAGGLLLASTLGTSAAFAQGNAGNGNNGNSGCTQTATGGGAATGGPQTNGRAPGTALIGGVIDVAVSDVLNNVGANLNALNGANVSVVCLNDALNQNNVQVLQDVLNGSPILSNNRDVLTNFLNDNNVLNGVSLLSGAQVVAVDLGSPTVAPTLYVVR
ncbi:MAG TPA: hypothetical protein VKV73_16355 [Chloroflexota bacterium]|nr:hypothetical protein [Chloroflexota bacterium]